MTPKQMMEDELLGGPKGKGPPAAPVMEPPGEAAVDAMQGMMPPPGGAPPGMPPPGGMPPQGPVPFNSAERATILEILAGLMRQ
jgi:hypothetical protein